LLIYGPIIGHDTRQNAQNIAVDGCLGQFEADRGNGTGGIRPDTGQLPDLGMILREKITLPDGCAYHHLAIDDVFDTDRVTGNIYADFGIGREDVLALF